MKFSLYSTYKAFDRVVFSILKHKTFRHWIWNIWLLSCSLQYVINYATNFSFKDSLYLGIIWSRFGVIGFQYLMKVESVHALSITHYIFIELAWMLWPLRPDDYNWWHCSNQHYQRINVSNRHKFQMLLSLLLSNYLSYSCRNYFWLHRIWMYLGIYARNK